MHFYTLIVFFLLSYTINWKEHRLGSFERSVPRKMSGLYWCD